MRCMQTNRIINYKGFTLIEVIASLIVVGIMGTMLISFMGTSVKASANPIIIEGNGAFLNSIMERMNSDYRFQMSLAALNGLPPSSGYTNFNDHVGAESSSKTYYSDGSHPYTVEQNRTITFDGSNNEASGSEIHKITIRYQGLSSTLLFME